MTSRSIRDKKDMDWHRLFGLLLMDFFTNSPFAVDVEKDLSVQQQLLDVSIVRKRRGRFAGRLPDGLDDLASHNLISFKSHHEALDDWVLKELTGHYVAYRKLITPRDAPMLPESEFRLYAVCSRFPQNLTRVLPLETIQQGVYRCRRGTDDIRIVVIGHLPEEEHNAPLHLFGASAEQVGYGARHYRRRSAKTSSLLDELFRNYEGEGITMSYTMEDFQRDYLRARLKEMTPEELREALKVVPVELLLERLSPEQRLQGLEPEQRLQGLEPEQRLQGLEPEQRLQGLEPEEIERALQKLKAGRETPRKARSRKRQVGPAASEG